MDPNEIKQIIESGLAARHVEVSGDGRHFEAIVVSDSFAGKSMIQQHRLVYATLGERFDTEMVHALSIRTYTPQEWERVRG